MCRVIAFPDLKSWVNTIQKCKMHRAKINQLLAVGAMQIALFLLPAPRVQSRQESLGLEGCFEIITEESRLPSSFKDDILSIEVIFRSWEILGRRKKHETSTKEHANNQNSGNSRRISCISMGPKHRLLYITT